MTWTATADASTGDLISSATWNTLLGSAGNLEELKLHTHDGTNGDGSQSLGPLVLGDFTDAAAPAAPGSGKTRIYATSSRPRFRAGAAGTDTGLALIPDVQVFTSTDTWTNPTGAKWHRVIQFGAGF